MAQDVKGSRASLQRAIEIDEILVAENPSVAKYQNGLAGRLVNLAAVSMVSQSYEEARDLLRRAEPHHRQALASNDKDPTYLQFFRNNRINLMVVCLEMKDHAEAAAAALQWADSASHPDEHFEAALYTCKCAALAQRDEGLAGEQRDATIKLYTDQALELIKQAIDGGFADVTRLETENDLLLVRMRPEFNDLLETIKRKE